MTPATAGATATTARRGQGIEDGLREAVGVLHLLVQVEHRGDLLTVALAGLGDHADARLFQLIEQLLVVSLVKPFDDTGRENLADALDRFFSVLPRDVRWRCESLAAAYASTASPWRMIKTSTPQP